MKVPVTLEQITRSLSLIDSILEEMEEHGDLTWFDTLCEARFPLAVIEDQLREISR